MGYIHIHERLEVAEATIERQKVYLKVFEECEGVITASYLQSWIDRAYEAEEKLEEVAKCIRSL